MTDLELLPQQALQRNLFGTDGIRGEATLEPGNGLINPQTFAGLGYAFVEELKENGHTGDIRVVIGRDPRRHSDIFAKATMCGVIAAGGYVIDADILPTPGVQRIAQQERDVDGAIIITASHNPPKDLGGKYTDKAFKLSEERGLDMSNRLWQHADNGLVIPNTLDLSRVEKRLDARETYISEIVEKIQSIFGLNPLEGKLFVVDCANGAAMNISPEVFEQLGAEVIRFGHDPKGDINDNCGSEHLGGLKAFLARNPKIAGRMIGAIAHDGDADRGNGVGYDDGEFLEITGNNILEAMAEYPKQPGVAGTIYINTATERRIRAMKQEDGTPVGFKYCKNGDTQVTRTLLDEQALGRLWTRGAERTAHSMFTDDWLTSGDGTFSMAWYACWAVTVKKATFGEIARAAPMWPTEEITIPTKGLPIPEDIGEHPEVLAAIEKELQELGGDGRVVLRPSGTEPKMRGMMEVPIGATSRDKMVQSIQRLGERAMTVAAELVAA